MTASAIKTACRILTSRKQSIEARVQAARDLANWRQGPAVLIQTATDLEAPAELRKATTWALSQSQDPESAIVLRRLTRDREPAVAREARRGLVQFIDPVMHDLPAWRKPHKALRGTKATFLQRAIDLAVENVQSGRGGPFGAVVVRQGRIFAEGVNLVTAVNDPTAHAEVIAIRAACDLLNLLHLSDCTMYSSCEPCPMCLGAIHWSRLGQLYFAATREDAAAAGFDDSFIYDQVPLAPASRSIPAKRQLAREGKSPVDAWLADTERLEY